MTIPALVPVIITYVVWIAIFTTGASRLSLAKRLLLIGAVTGLLQLPVLGTTPFLYLRGVFGDFSMTHTLWAFIALSNRIFGRQLIPIPQRQKITVTLLLVVLAICFYPSALGATDFDVYRLGFEPFSMLVVLAVVALLAWQLRQYFLLAAISFAVVAFRFQLLESTNLWDYLFDPLLVLYSAAWLIATLLRFIFDRVMQPPEPIRRYGTTATTPG